MKSLRMSTSAPSVAGGAPERSFSFRRGIARQRGCVSMKWLVGLTITSVAPAAIRADERPVIADVPATAPFDAPQLAAALRLRLPASGAPIRVRVVTTPDGVRIEAGGSVREVALRGNTGPDAARLVALAATDLLLEELVVA